MNIEQIRSYCLLHPGTTEDMPYGDDMVVFRVGGKIYLHLPLEYAEPRMSVKLDPAVGLELREKYNAVTPGYHLNKNHWNDILIDGYFSDDQLRAWIDASYQIVLNHLPKAVRQQL